MQIILEFKIELSYQDYWQLRNGDSLHLIWTHYDAMEWLELLGYTNLLTEEYFPSLNMYLMRSMYRIDDKTLDILLLKWPKILEPVRTYESIKLNYEFIIDK